MKQYSELRWRCRRGLRETDILLQRFLKDQYEHAAPKEKQHFEALLNETDLDILAWITARSSPPERYTNIITIMRNKYLRRQN